MADTMAAMLHWPGMDRVGVGPNIAVVVDADGNPPAVLVDPYDAEGRRVEGTWELDGVNEARTAAVNNLRT